jgi:hypothetical protein
VSEAAKITTRYQKRKRARLNGAPVSSRFHEPAPWYTFTIRGQANVSEDGRVRLEREMREHAEKAAKRANARLERMSLFDMLEAEGYISR